MNELIFTSYLFFIPAVYSYYISIYELSILNTIVGIASIIYWRNPSSKNGLLLDLCMSRISGLTYLVYGYNHVTDTSIRKYAYVNLSIIIFFYTLSNVLYRLEYKKWVYSHMGFHIFSVVSKIMILSQIRR